MELSALQYLLGTAAGAFVGFVLGLIGGGGSILALPLMVYAVGVRDPHLAVGTSALAVAANAAANAFNHARAGTVRWQIAGIFAAAGVGGAWVGSLAGKALAGERLLACFGVLMLLVSALMLRKRPTAGAARAVLSEQRTPKLLLVGVLTGAVSGFFGIGGGFLIVPGLMYAARLPIIEAVGSSLLAVTAFSLTTALNYARSGWVDWGLAAVFALGGLLGGAAGAHLARRLSVRRGALEVLFAVLIFIVGLYVLERSLEPLGFRQPHAPPA
jgi:uncharacterized protein